ncbi:MurR/RpiR family transcriptional regulator [Amycolatopsis sp. FDAARGOS 1241]|uniref:MurR/RpiR family transcriptional regulator n=1 Tax=Amycolatopsis sp. FDAARGOS 1241 TaxID=2778070 RepID=UPI00194E2FF3|nr:MurR/RpiR family transcriptional regulator [Amycolatopsis sp. FDAARGOS 1241]QRP47714.1 MurR/RpiR family transcriptional regulator [Amycolatopsis sp. FDAARGOS 1241]
MTDEEDALRARIARCLPKMSRAERTVAEYLRDHGRDAIFATAEQIGDATETSDATVVRTAKSLGFTGLLDLRRSLAREVVLETSPSHRVLHNAPDGVEPTGDAIVDQVFTEATERLAATWRLVRSADFTHAVDLLDGAREVLSFGLGGSGLVARYLRMRLVRMGRRARSTGATGFQLADDLIGLAPEDVVVLYVPARLLGELEVLLDHAHAVGARVILVSSSLGPLFGSQVDVVLTAPKSASNYTGEMLTAEVLTDALLLRLASRDETRATTTSELLTSLRSDLITGEGRGARGRLPGSNGVA